MEVEMRRTLRFLLAFLACIGVGAWVFTLAGYEGYALTWAGSAFRATSGGCMGYIVSRWGLGLDLSEIERDQRPVAALSQAILIAAGAIAVAVGV